MKPNALLSKIVWSFDHMKKAEHVHMCRTLTLVVTWRKIHSTWSRKTFLSNPDISHEAAIIWLENRFFSSYVQSCFPFPSTPFSSFHQLNNVKRCLPFYQKYLHEGNMSTEGQSAVSFPSKKRGELYERKGESGKVFRILPCCFFIFRFSSLEPLQCEIWNFTSILHEKDRRCVQSWSSAKFIERRSSHNIKNPP